MAIRTPRPASITRTTCHFSTIMKTNLSKIDSSRELRQRNWTLLCEELLAICKDEPGAFSEISRRLENLATRLTTIEQRQEIAEQTFATLSTTLLSLSKHRLNRVGDP